jgi:hypothetical protein
LIYRPETAQATAGQLTATAETVAWFGPVPPEQPVVVAFQAQVDPNLGETFRWIQNEALIDDGYHILRRKASIVVNGRILYLPVIVKAIN